MMNGAIATAECTKDIEGSITYYREKLARAKALRDAIKDFVHKGDWAECYDSDRQQLKQLYGTAHLLIEESQDRVESLIAEQERMIEREREAVERLLRDREAKAVVNEA